MGKYINKNKHYKKACALVGALMLLITLIQIPFLPVKADEASEPILTYTSHVQSLGWLNKSSSGYENGTTGQSKRMEALVISLELNGAKAYDGADLYGSIICTPHVQGTGWMEPVEFTTGQSIFDAVSSGIYAGTTGQSKRLEAFTLKLTGNIANEYDILYRVHVQGIGWMGWKLNGDTAGTVGKSLRIEAVQIKLRKKNHNSPKLVYQVYAQGNGWMNEVSSSEYDISSSTIAGTQGESKRLEAVKISLNSDIPGNVEYNTHCQSYGWLNTVSNGQISGTQNEGKQLEAIQIKLTGEISNYYDIYYRAHVQGIGWMGWAKNGENAGTSGGGRRMEAIQLVLVPKGDDTLDRSILPYRVIEDFSHIPGDFVIKVNKQCNTITVYKGDTPCKAMVCSTGAGTPLGTFNTSDKYRWRNLFFNSWGQYCTRITGHILFHSVPYYSQNNRDLETEEFNKLGTEASAGCIRLQFIDAKWIYDNCPSGTTVIIYNDSNPGPLGKPTAPKIPANQTWDPTDTEL